MKYKGFLSRERLSVVEVNLSNCNFVINLIFGDSVVVMMVKNLLFVRALFIVVVLSHIVLDESYGQVISKTNDLLTQNSISHKSEAFTIHERSNQIFNIKKAYGLGIYYYNKRDFKLAEKEFVKVLKPILSKPKINTLHQSNIKYIKNELLDSMYHLGLIYLEDTSYPNNYVKAAAIFQYCFGFAKKYKIESTDSKFFLNEAYNVEKKFLQSINKDSNNIRGIYYRKRIIQYKNELNIFREKIKQKLDTLNTLTIKDIILRAKKIETISQECTNYYKKGLVQKLLADCNKQLGGPPKGCEYAVVSFGSFPKGTITPWSDLEFAILINEDNEEYKQYFLNLTKLLRIKIVNLGETPLNWVGIEALHNFKTAKEEDEWFWDDVMKAGFSFDGTYWHNTCETSIAKHWYNVKKTDFGLILSPSEMAEFQREQTTASKSPNWFNSDKNLVQALRSVSLIDGSKTLLDDYILRIKKIVSLDTVRKRTIEILQENINEFYLKLSREEEGKSIDVKNDIYRLVERIISELSIYYNVIPQNEQKPMTFWNILDQMKTMGILSAEGTQHLKEALSIAVELRLRTYYNNFGSGSNKAIITTYIPEHLSTEEKHHFLKEVFYINDISIMHHFYQVMLKVQDLIQDFCNPKYNKRVELILKTDKLYLNDDRTIDMINKRFSAPSVKHKK